MAVLKYHYQTI